MRKRRLELGISIAEVARRSGIARERVSKIENGHTGVGPTTAAKLAPALGLETEELLPAQLEPANLTTVLLRLDAQGSLLRHAADLLLELKRDSDELLARLELLESGVAPPRAPSRASRMGNRRAGSN